MERRRLLGALAAAVPVVIAAVVGARRIGTGASAGSDGRAPEADGPTSPSAPAADAVAPTTPATPGEGDGPASDTAATEGPVLAVLCREALGLAAALPGGIAHEPVRVTVHHSAIVLEDAGRAPAQLRAFQADHQRRGWSDVAYHLAVDPDGNVYELRDPLVAGDSGTPYDTTGHLQLLCLGDFDQQEPTAAQLEALAALVAAECAARGIPVETLTAHRDHVLTWCPGEALYARMEDVSARASELLASGAPTLRRFCGEEGTARVAAIEAGA